ncbi:MAG: type II secretion system F family protein [Patescibacteria group bacterium]
MNTANAAQTEKLDQLLNNVQKESVRDEFIYGVTNRAGRSFGQRFEDFFIDRRSVPDKEKAYFFELLATMLKAGIPLNQSLKILTSRTDHPRLRRIIATLSYELEHGKPLSLALDRFPDVFEETERGTIRSAEAVGHLEPMLTKIASTLDKRSDLMMRLKAAMIYPIAVLTALVITGSIMLVFVVPRMQEIFKQSNLELPLATRALLAVSGFVSQFWWLFMILAIFGVVFFHWYTHSEDGRFSWDFRKLRIPLFGSILRKMYVLRFVDTFGLLMESGLPIHEALGFVASSVGNEIYRMKTYEALGAVQEGKQLSASLAQAPFLFPETVTNMLAVAEKSATLGDLSQKVGEHYEREIDHTLKNMTTVLGPMLILFIGATVAFFAIAVLSPIFSLTESV